MAKKKGGNNNQNLKPVTSTEEARKRGRNGGIKSQQVQRERKKARECMEMILKLDAKGKKSRELMTNMGIADEEQQNIMLLMATMFAKAASTGDPTAISKILEIAGELEAGGTTQAPTINISVSAATTDDIDEE